MVYYPPSMVNANQSSQERSQKYWTCRSAGCNSAEANRMRDWRWDYIKWFIERWIKGTDPPETFNEIRHRLSREYELAGIKE